MINSMRNTLSATHFANSARKLKAIAAASLCALFIFISSGALASDEYPIRVLVLDFELNDLTLHPDIEGEAIRVKKLRPFLEQFLKDDFAYEIASLPQDERDHEDKGRGYIFDRPEVSADMANRADAEWTVTGKLHKASFLFVYLLAQLVNAETGKVAADFVVEIKGWEPKLTKKGVESLALQIDESLKTLTGK